MNDLPKRKQIRLANYDYSENGYYFVTICTKGRKPLFRNIEINRNDSVGADAPGNPGHGNAKIPPATRNIRHTEIVRPRENDPNVAKLKFYIKRKKIKKGAKVL